MPNRLESAKPIQPNSSRCPDLYAPLNIPKSFAENVWIVDGGKIQFRHLLFSVPLPTRMTLMRLFDGSLVVHSPIALTAELERAVRSLGLPRYLVAPNTLHYSYVPNWRAHFHETRLFAASGLDRAMKRPISIDTILGHQPPPEWANEIDQVVISGDLLTEIVFFHRASRTLILTDMIENFELNRVHCLLYRFMLRMSGAVDPDGTFPRGARLGFLRHGKALRAAVEQILGWKPEQIILAHG